MNFPRPRKLRLHLTSVSACMSSNSKPTNHYETLNIAQNATQEEIKAAYYKLTKQYHPDVNKTEEAKGKFRDVSEAYEVIGNYKARRQYDRGMIARGTAVSSVYKNEKEPEHMAFYRSRMNTYRRPVQTPISKVYDFDTWTRAHYGYTLKKTVYRRQVNIDVAVSKQKVAVDSRRLSYEFAAVVGVTVLVLVAVIFAEIKDNFDDIVIKNSEESKKENEL